MARDDFSARVVRALQARVGYRCSNPDCRVPTSGPRDDEGAVSIGQAAHITAASQGGPRFDAKLTSGERSAMDNGIWLCGLCAPRIDKDEGAYPPARLRKWKRLAERRAREEQGRPQPRREDAQEQLASVLTAAPMSRFIPAALPNVHAAVEQTLRQLDPRFEVETGFAQGTPTFTLRPLEQVRVNMSVPQTLAAAWIDGMQLLADHGKEVSFPADNLTITGSPLLEKVFSELNGPGARLHVGSADLGAILKLTLVEPGTSNSEVLDEVHGRVSLGRRSMSFEGAGYSGTLRLSATMGFEPGDVRSLRMTFNLGQWNGNDIRRLPHFDKLVSLVKKLRAGCQISFGVEVEGDLLGSGKAESLAREHFIATEGVLDYLALLRTIATFAAVPIPLVMGYTITREDLSGAANIVETIEGRRIARGGDAEELRISLVANGDSVTQVLNNADGLLRIVEPEPEFQVFHTLVSLPTRVTYFKGGRAHLAEPARAFVDGDKVEVVIIPTERFWLQSVFESSHHATDT